MVVTDAQTIIVFIVSLIAVYCYWTKPGENIKNITVCLVAYLIANLIQLNQNDFNISLFAGILGIASAITGIVCSYKWAKEDYRRDPVSF